MSLGDCIDAKYVKPGATQETIDQMAKLGVFTRPIERVCEIGPGSGRYLEKTLHACNPAYYEIYETSKEWAAYLAMEYKVTVRPCDGVSLSHTPSMSIDLVQAHKVFVALPFLLNFRYFDEMIRVVRPSGTVVFDVLTEDCMNDPTLEKWVATARGWNWTPSVMPKQLVIEHFKKHNFTFTGTFFIPLIPGIIQYMIFSKQ
jgi:SAM-dependent methyltransferase